MALYVLNAPPTALTTAATKSILLHNAASPTVKIRQVDVSMNASAVATAVQIDLYRVVTIGSAAGASQTAVPADAGDIAALSTGCLSWLTTEPTTVTVIASYEVQPLGGLFVLPFPYGAEIVARSAGARIGLRYVSASGVTPVTTANIWFEE